jgi:hypothetical protein
MSDVTKALIERVEGVLGRVETKLDNHGQRIAVLEERTSPKWPAPVAAIATLITSGIAIAALLT